MPDATIAVADIGSTTVHLLVGRIRRGGKLESLHDDSVRPLLGWRSDADGAIRSDAEAEVLATLHRFRQVAADLRAERFVIVATQAALARQVWRLAGRLV